MVGTLQRAKAMRAIQGYLVSFESMRRDFLIQLAELCPAKSLIFAFHIILVIACKNLAAEEPVDSPNLTERTISNERDIESLLNSLANANSRPTEIDVSTRYSTRSPLFSQHYDWTEDDRVRRKVGELDAKIREGGCACLMGHLADERYALTYAFNDGLYIDSIADLCWRKLVFELQYPFWQFVPGIDYGEPLRELRIVNTLEELNAWHKNHMGTLFYLQQIELCELALARAEKLQLSKRVSAHQKREFIEKIKSQIDKLAKSKKPILSTQNLLPVDTDYYDESMASEIRHKFCELKRKDEN